MRRKRIVLQTASKDELRNVSGRRRIEEEEKNTHYHHRRSFFVCLEMKTSFKMQNTKSHREKENIWFFSKSQIESEDIRVFGFLPIVEGNKSWTEKKLFCFFFFSDN